MPGYRETVADKLAFTYTEALGVVWDRTHDRKIAMQAAERALRDHESDLRNGIDVRRPVLSLDGPLDEVDVYDPEALDRLLASIGYNPPSCPADVPNPEGDPGMTHGLTNPGKSGLADMQAPGGTP
jgi:hypothetical protein